MEYYFVWFSDEPPPPPSHPPPKIKKKEIVEIEEKFESVIVPDQATEQFQTRIEPDPEPTKPLIDYAGFEKVITELFPQNKKFFLTYNKVPWTLHIRKEVWFQDSKCYSSKLDDENKLIYERIVKILGKITSGNSTESLDQNKITRGSWLYILVM